MYHPGGATFRSAGTSAFTVSGGTSVNGTSTSRCVPLNEWVVRPGRIRLIHFTWIACGVWIAILELYLISSGAFWITGRVSFLKQYGGLKISRRIPSIKSVGRQITCAPVTGFPYAD